MLNGPWPPTQAPAPGQGCVRGGGRCVAPRPPEGPAGLPRKSLALAGELGAGRRCSLLQVLLDRGPGLWMCNFLQGRAEPQAANLWTPRSPKGRGLRPRPLVGSHQMPDQQTGQELSNAAIWGTRHCRSPC